MPQYLIDGLTTVVTAKGNDVTDPRDYLTAFYGSVPQSVRELYFGYLGWFQADPVGLAPTPPQPYATKIVALMGGRDKVLGESRLAFDRKEYQFAAELASLLVTMDPQDKLAREAKAKAFVELAVPQTNPNWRNWFLVAANELRGIYPRPDSPAISGGLTSPGIVDALPYATWVNQWSLRLKAEETIRNNVQRTLGFYFAPAEANQEWQGYVIDVRRGVAEVILTGPLRESVASRSKLYIEMDKKAESALIWADTAGTNRPFEKILAELMEKGVVKVYGGKPEEVLAFFALFDSAPETLPPLAAR